MCGIIGIVGPGSSVKRRNEIEGALSFLKERGPDHQGIWAEGEVGLGHTRLSIIDLDPRSNQPFLVEDRVALTYNGEIYNFQHLKRELTDAARLAIPDSLTSGHPSRLTIARSEQPSSAASAPTSETGR